LRLFSFGGYGLALAALALMVFGAIECPPEVDELSLFQGKEQEIGIVGLLLIASGIVSSAICGFILDHTHAFKQVFLRLLPEVELITLFGNNFYSNCISGQLIWFFTC